MLRYLEGLETADAPADALTRAAGSGPGGARPKITVAYTVDGALVADNGVVPGGATPWIVKFHSIDDSPYLSSVEATYLQMASATGITVCEHRLLAGSSGTQYLAVRRFDRAPVRGDEPRRIHMATAAGVLEAYPEYDQHTSYDAVIRLTRMITGNRRDVVELVRRAVFNVVAHNRDDHARNISFLWSPTAGWSLAPAYDLTHSMGPRPAFVGAGPGEHYLDVAGKGKDITRDDLKTLCKPAQMKPHEIDDLIDAALAAVHTWPDLAAPNGVDDATIEQVGNRLPALG
jgi:serine/threonine-protein kinase HipA